MCGRYQAWLDDEELLGILDREKQKKYFKQEEVFPGSVMPLFYSSFSADGAIEAHISEWGFTYTEKNSRATAGFVTKRVINARSETAEERPMFRDSFRESRALVLASGYYEWHAGIKYYISPGNDVSHSTFDKKNNNSAFLMAALERGDGFARQYVIITTPAIGTPARIHDRMPLFIRREDMKKWLCDYDYARYLLRHPQPCGFSVTA